MYITNITDDYNDTLSINNNCTNNDNNIDITIIHKNPICFFIYLFNIFDGIQIN